jgi:hypothetical protein
LIGLDGPQVPDLIGDEHELSCGKIPLWNTAAPLRLIDTSCRCGVLH